LRLARGPGLSSKEFNQAKLARTCTFSGNWEQKCSLQSVDNNSGADYPSNAVVLTDATERSATARRNFAYRQSGALLGFSFLPERSPAT